MSALSTAHALMHLANHVLAEAARAAAKESAIAKLEELGLTEAEISALVS
jgi:hypothetical protein